MSPYRNVPDELQDKMESCVQKVMDKNGGDKESAIAICYASVVEGQTAAHDFILNPSALPAKSDFLLDNYVSTKPGDAYRLFPFGRIVKNGKARDITPESAAKFRLPHFKPPVKLGSHDEATPAGGHIIRLSVRGDGNCELCKAGKCNEHGLFADTEVNEKGLRAMADGAYRYHSPEVIWEGGSLEDPTTGKPIEGPLIVGDALLHTPHLGEATALYTIQPMSTGGDLMSEETVNVPTSLWDKYIAPLLARKEQPAETPAPVIEPEKFAAIQTERDEYKAKVEAMESEKAKQARIDAFGAKLKETIVNDGAEILAAMTDEQADWVLQKFNALSAQIKVNDKLTTEIGHNEPTLTGKAAIDAAIQAKAKEKGLSYVDAFTLVRSEQPDLFKSI